MEIVRDGGTRQTGDRGRSLSTATVVTLLAILLVLILGAGQIARSRAVAIASASQQTLNLVNVLAQQASRTFESVDLILTGVQERLRNPDPHGLTDYLRRRAATLPQLREIRVSDADGATIASSLSQAPGADPAQTHADQPFFARHRGSDDPGPHVGMPIAVGGGETVIPVSRRLSKPDGSFDGVVSAMLDADYVRSFYESIDLGANGAIALWLSEGKLLVREPVPSPAMARDLSTIRLFTHLVRQTKSGIVQAPSSAVDGLPRIVGYQSLDRFPMVVTASMSIADALEAWRHDTTVQGAVMAIVTLALIGLAAGLEHRSRRIAASERLANEARTLFKGLFSNATDAFFVYRVEAGGGFRLETWNQAAAERCGLDEASGPGRGVGELLGADDAAKTEAELRRVVSTGRPIRIEDRSAAGAGSRIWDVIHVPLRDPGSDGVGRVFVGARDITHLKKAEAEAREANRLLVMAEQLAHVGHWHVAIPSMVLTWSDEVYRIHGLDPATFTPTLESAIALYHPDDRADVERHVNQALATGLDFAFDLRIVRPDGSIRHLQARGLCEASPREGEEARALFGAVADITDLKRAQQALSEKSALFEAALQSMDQGLLMIAPDGTVPVANGRALELLGLPEALMAARPAYRAVREHMRRTGAWGESIEDSKYWHLDHNRRTADLISERRRGDGSVIEIRSLPMQGGDGYVQTLTDITERRLAQERLRESEARYRLLADYTSDIVVLGDAAGIPSYVSPAVTQTLGYGVDEVMTVGLLGLTRREDVPCLVSALKSLSPGNPTGSVVYRMRHRAGDDVWIEAALRHVEEAGVAQVVMALRDVTLRQHQSTSLEQAKVAAEAGARVKAEFLANMSHELRTPLTGMLGVHDLLRGDPSLSPAQGRLVKLAQESGRSLLTIVNDILDFSKMEAGQLAIEAVPFGLRSLVAGCRDLVAEAARERDLTIVADIADDVPDAFVGDPARLRQVLLNLTTNAIKFTPAGGVSLHVRWLDGAERPRLRIEVVDTGIGIAADQLPHLFQRFSQADGSISRTYGGTGLGLAISRRLVEMMGGELGVTSDLGAGSTFWLELPLSPQSSPASATAPTGPAPAAPGPYRILFAEDNLVNQEIISAVLRQKGHAVEVVGDGAAAVAASETETFDVVLMDVQMPGQDGLAATGAIRERERLTGRSRLPIVALTANALAEEVTRCRSAGMDGHVAKPVDWPELFAEIDRVLRKIGSSGPMPTESREDVVVFDEGILDDLAEAIGPKRVTALLATFEDDLRRRVDRLGEAGLTPATLRAEAHALVSLAGQLGFVELSALCARIERQAEAGLGLDRIPALHAAATRAIAAAGRSHFA